MAVVTTTSQSQGPKDTASTPGGTFYVLITAVEMQVAWPRLEISREMCRGAATAYSRLGYRDETGP